MASYTSWRRLWRRVKYVRKSQRMRCFSVWGDRRERKNASRRRRGKVGTLKKHKGSTGERQCRTHHRERTACWRCLWRGVGICVEESENAVCSVCGTTGESARMPAGGGKSGTLKKHKGSTGGKCQCRRGAVNTVRTTEIGRCVATHWLQRSLSRSENVLRSVSRECKNASRRTKKGTKR